MSKRLIVTGGAGFIGANLVAELNARGHTDILIVDFLDNDLKRTNLNRLTFGDYVDRDDFRRRFLAGKVEPAESIFHLGACSSTTQTDERYMMDNNFRYSRELCEWCMASGTRLIYASSAATYGDGSAGFSDSNEATRNLHPLNLYARSKHMFDVWALDSGILDRAVGLKYFNVYGPWEDHKGDMRSVVNKAYGEIRRTAELRLFKSCRPEYRDGEQNRDFVYVQDAVKVTLFFYDHPDSSGLFNCGTGRARTWIELGEAVFDAMGKETRIRFVDMPEQIREKYQYHTCADISKLRAAGYVEPFVPIEEGARHYVRNYLARPLHKQRY